MTYKMKASVRAVALALALGTASYSAHAVLERVGPTNPAPSVGSYPAWYQDTTGVALEFCDPKNQAEVDGGWCLLLPGDVTVPEVFPTNYFDEHFWYAADALMTTTNGGTALLVLAVEAAFAADVVPGGQITFSRIRVKLTNVPVSGTYRFIHPYGEEVIEAVAGDRIFFTDDVGITCPPGQFDCALDSRLGPFLLPSDTPGGAELPPVAGPVPGKLYIADPSRSGPVTGSTLPAFTDSTGATRNHNIFRIEGPAGSALSIDPATGVPRDYIETTDFSLMGRLHTGTLPSRIDVERANYTRNAAGQRLDVYATASSTTQARLPAQPKPAVVAPQLTFYDAPCAGTVDEAGTIHPPYSAPLGATETQMFSRGSVHWGQIDVAGQIPPAVCLKDGSARDANGNLKPAFSPQAVSDEVTITQALYDPNAGTLTVKAGSSDETVPPRLSLAIESLRVDLTNGEVVVSEMIAPPAKVRVLSSALGADQQPVSTLRAGAPAPIGIPVARNDSFVFPEDSAAVDLAVLANDTDVAGGTVTLTSAPRLGTAAVNADGTVRFTPNPNAFGGDAFTYTVSVGSNVSNTGSVTLDITPLNDAPTAVNDAANTIVNAPTAINVLANDIDPDGSADLASVAIVSQPAPGASISVNGGIVTFTATAGGSYSFTYQALDTAGLASANAATVTVQVAAAETVSITRAEYVRSKGRLKAQGTISPAANQTITLQFVNSSGTVVGEAGTAQADAAGAWIRDATVPLPTGATVLRATSSNGTVRNTALQLK
jgi:hypothetical protein